jgi:hypothetical protein
MSIDTYPYGWKQSSGWKTWWVYVVSNYLSAAQKSVP